MPSFATLLSALALPLLVSAAPAKDHIKCPKGLVSANGATFQQNGKNEYFAGTNAYWLAQLPQQSELDTVLKSMADFGVKVVRTWAFSGVNSTENLDPNLVYYTVWNGNKFTLNEGPNGLSRLDAVVKTAEKYGLQLIMTMANNWGDYFGMDQINYQIIPDWQKTQYHSDFYQNPDVIAAYQSYVSSIVNRYKSSSAIFAWELANEARISGYPSIGEPGINSVAVLQKWYSDQSAFIKSIDSCHMVAAGDEGYFNRGGSDYIYNGGSGNDFDATIRIPTIDFGTFHLYPESWSETPYEQWGNQYILDHIAVQKSANKPVVLEEFGMSKNKTGIYPIWFNTALQGKLGAIMPWQWGSMGLPSGGVINGTGYSPDDTFTFYPSQPEWKSWQSTANTLNAESGKKH